MSEELKGRIDRGGTHCGGGIVFGQTLRTYSPCALGVIGEGFGWSHAGSSLDRSWGKAAQFGEKRLKSSKKKRLEITTLDLQFIMWYLLEGR